uniref:ORFB 193 n=1 Tax=Desulfurococcus mucosus TaxID=2275 RepID=Q46515_DESMO|nr:unnamed protein product [Desulfurococcus mucosus DSM 2161]
MLTCAGFISSTWPIPIVLPMSLIANLPRPWKSEYFSTTSGLIGLNFTIAMSPCFRKCGFFSISLPVLGSIFAMISVILQATLAVWTCITGVYPTAMAVGCHITIILAVNSSATVGGTSSEPATSPRLISFFSTPFTLNPMLSPGSAFSILVWCVSMVLTSATSPAGMNTSLSPTFSTPVSTLPTGTTPMPEIL